MTDYNLAGLNTREFEHLVQALAVKIFGFKTIVFGDGKDGGREATFTGSANYPSENDSWNGYIVIQAKFKQRPQTPKDDGEWALKELKKELMDYADSQSNRVKPEYYILATNVILTPVQDDGTKDKVYNLFQEFKNSIPCLKDYDIWDYDKIRAYLDQYEDIRKTYARFITPSDLIVPIVKEYQARQKSIEAYLEQQIKPKPDEKIFDEENITFRDLYVPLQVQVLDDNGKPIAGEIYPIEDLAIKIISDKEESKKILFIQGEAGRGKSVFTRMFADRIRQDRQLNFTPILIRLRDIRVLENNLTKTLENQLETFEFVKGNPGWLTDKDTKFLFLLDGFDELLLEGRSSGGLQEFLQQVEQFQQSSHHRFLVTGRPLALQGIDRLISQTRSLERVEIQSMNDLIRQTWLDKWSAKVGFQERNNFQEFLNSCPEEIKNKLAREPLLLYLLARMHREEYLNTKMFTEAKGITAKITIYDRAIEWVLEKQREDENFKLTGLDKEDLRRFLTEVALCVVQSGNESTSVKTLEIRLKDTNDPVAQLIQKAKERISLENVKEEKVLNNLLTAFYIKPASGEDGGSIEFVHKSFGEFLFAERLAESFVEWTSPKTSRYRQRQEDLISTGEMDKAVYDLLGYGNLTPEIVEYLMGLLTSNQDFNSQNWLKLFTRLENFYFRWSDGEFIDAQVGSNWPFLKKEQLEKQSLRRGNYLGLRQVDIYTGLNVMILLFELHRYAQLQNDLKDKIKFHPCIQQDTDKIDKTRLLRIIRYSQCLSETAFERILIFFLSFTNLAKADLSGADLSGADLIGADLSGADLSGAYLRRADLIGADLSGADLSVADLIEADLSGADLSGAYLSKVKLTGADLRGADLSEADLMGADLRGANLIGADLSEADLSEADLSEADLRGADLRGADLSEADLRGADLRGADLSEANLSEANLSEADLSVADLHNARLNNVKGANFTGAILD